MEKLNQENQLSIFGTHIPSDLPKPISNASILLYLSLLIGLINSFILEFTTEFKNLSDPRALTILILTLILMFFFAYKIHLGKPWARITFLVLFILGLIFYPSTLIQFFKLNPLAFIISLLQSGMQIFALFCFLNRNLEIGIKGLKKPK